MDINTTIQTRVNHIPPIVTVIAGYAEITEQEHRGIVSAFDRPLFCVLLNDTGLANVYMLAATTKAFLIETMDHRFFVANEDAA